MSLRLIRMHWMRCVEDKEKARRVIEDDSLIDQMEKKLRASHEPFEQGDLLPSLRCYFPRYYQQFGAHW